MQLTREQKNQIKKNIRRIPLEQIARNIGADSKDILEYLKKKWRKDKFQKFLKEMETEKTRPPETGNFSRKNKLIIFGLAGLVLLVYFNSLNNGFVSDDIGAIVKNDTIGNFNAIFSSLFGSLQTFIRFLTFHIFGIDPQPYRLFNILLHMGSAILVFMILNRLYSRSIAVFAALLFAVHPLLVESITWISGMPYALYGFLFLLSFYFYLHAESKGSFYYFSIVAFFLACISSEKAIPLFLIFIFYEWIFKHNKNFWKVSAPFAAIALILGIMFAGGFGQRVTELESSTYREENQPQIIPLAQVPVAVSHYLKLLVWPSNLTLYHTEMSFSKGMYFLMTLTFLTVLAVLIYSFKKNRNVFFWLIFFFIALSATLAPLGVAWIVAERYAYLASLGIFVIAAFGIDWLYEKIKATYKVSFGREPKNLVYIFFAIIIISLSARTILRNNDWENEDTLWIATAEVSPSGQNIHNNLGDVYGRQGNYEKAAEEFKKAIEINPRYAEAYHNLANTYRDMGKVDLAVENYQKAIDLKPDLWQSLQNLAAVYLEQEDYHKAAEYMEKALQANPEDENLKQNLETIKNKL